MKLLCTENEHIACKEEMACFPRTHSGIEEEGMQLLLSSVPHLEIGHDSAGLMRVNEVVFTEQLVSSCCSINGD